MHPLPVNGKSGTGLDDIRTSGKKTLIAKGEKTLTAEKFTHNNAGPQRAKRGKASRPKFGKNLKRASNPRQRPEFGNPGPDRVQLFGLHAVAAALANPARQLLKLYLTENAERRLAAEFGADIPLAVDRVLPKDLDRRLGPDTVHQGAMLETAPLPEPEFDDLAAASASGRPLLVLDQVTDPHNVGAILRSAAVFGACGLVMTRRHSPPLTGVLAKSASGALDVVPVALVPNLARALEALRTSGFLVVGLDGESESRLEQLDWKQPIALVFGAEGKGLRELTRKSCDQLARITTDGQMNSLNVSNAAAVSLHCAAIARSGQS